MGAGMSRKLFPLSLAATLVAGTALADVPRVAVDIAPIHSLVARVMLGVGEPHLVIPPGASPHEYNLRPSEAKALQDASHVFWIGEDLTPWMADAIANLAEDAEVTSLLEAEGVTLLDFRENALFEAHAHDHEDHDHDHEDHAEGEKHDHDHGDHFEAAAHDHDHNHDHAEHAEKADDDHDHGHEDHAENDHDHDHEDHAEHDHDHGHEEHAGAHDHAHGEHDPHAWLSPANAATWLNVIAGKLSAADPDNAGVYFANAAAAREELEGLSGEINASLDPVRGGRFIVFHDAYQYFEAAYGFPASGAISLSDAANPSPARISEIQARVADEGIQCVLSEPQFDPGIIAVVMDGTEAKTAVLDPIGSDLEPGPALYPELLRNLANALVRCLQ
jgi:zinc transport system substrate-binding protein